MHRVAIGDLSDWASNAAEDSATFTVTNDTYHPMIESNQTLYIGDGYYTTSVEDGTFTADALDILTPCRVTCLSEYDIDLLIGTMVARQ